MIEIIWWLPELLIRKAVNDVIQALPIQNIKDPNGKAEQPVKQIFDTLLQ